MNSSYHAVGVVTLVDEEQGLSHHPELGEIFRVGAQISDEFSLLFRLFRIGFFSSERRSPNGTVRIPAYGTAGKAGYNPDPVVTFDE